jgi:hypothetical protein
MYRFFPKNQPLHKSSPIKSRIKLRWMQNAAENQIQTPVIAIWLW